MTQRSILRRNNFWIGFLDVPRKFLKDRLHSRLFLCGYEQEPRTMSTSKNTCCIGGIDVVRGFPFGDQLSPILG